MDVRRVRRLCAGRPVFEFDWDDVPRSASVKEVEIEQGKKLSIPSCNCSGFKLYPYSLPYTIGSGE